MSDHKVELIDATISLIKTAIYKFANNPTTDKARKNMFLIERIPASGAVKSIKLIGNMSTGAIKQLTVDVDCENNLMLLLMSNYFVQHALALVSMATRGEPVSEFFDQFAEYLEAKKSAATKYCKNGGAGSSPIVAMAAGGGGGPSKKKKKKTNTKKSATTTATAAAAKKKKNALAAKKKKTAAAKK